MENLDAVFFFFVIVIAIIAILVGREFIRARRERVSQEAEDKSRGSVDADALAVEEAEEEVAEEPEEEEAEEEEEEEPEEEEAEEEVAEEPEEEEAEEEEEEEKEGGKSAKKAKVSKPEAVEREGHVVTGKAETKSLKKENAAKALEEKPVEEAAKAVEQKKPSEKKEPEPAAAALTKPVSKPVSKPKPEKEIVKPDVEKQRLKKGLKKTRGGFVSRLGRLFKGKRELSPELMDKLEEVIFTADIGVKTSEKLFASVKDALGKKQLNDPDAVWTFIKNESERFLDVDAPPMKVDEHKPFVILTIGVNGVGKTTTIGKLAGKFVKEGKSVLLAAGDTFRAAAVEQLTIWGDRVGCPVVKGKPEADPSSVIFDAIKKAKEDDIDIVIADTAGRLHTKVSLMDELKKIHRVMGKAAEGAPHETLLVLDATNGQNAIQQALLFKEAVEFTGIILTKLDGTAKGGIILGICDELGVPVRYVGIGEREEDLREFSSKRFIDALYADSEETQ